MNDSLQYNFFPEFTDHSPVFVGRRSEMAQLEQHIVRGNRRVVCIFGIGGIGKTALAQAFGRRFAEVHGGNLISLAGTRELFSLDMLDERLRRTNTPTLVIVNDAEQLNGEAREHLLGRLLPQFPHCRLILTSREIFHDPRIDWVLHLDGFNDAESEQLLQSLLGDRLYWTDLKSHKIYDTLRGHPLALNLIAGALKSGALTPDEISRYLEPFIQQGVRSPDGRPLEEESEPYTTIVSNVTTVSDEFLNKLADNPSLLYEVSPRAFEEIVAELLSRQGYSVELTPASRDGGKDIYIATKDSLGSFLYLVECKRYAPDRPVGVGFIRQLYGTVQAERATAGILATTSFFTRGAKDFQSKVEFQISLQDYLGIQKWINAAL